MPFLRAAQKSSRREKVESKKAESEKVADDLSGIRNVKSDDDDRQTKIPFPTSDGEDSSQVKGNAKKDKGTAYELFVGHIYENHGYKVDYVGIEKGGRDGGIDLICHHGRYSILVQCKCYEATNSKITVGDIHKFYGAFRHYAIKHPTEVVQGAFWTTKKLREEAKVFEAVIELGIALHDGVAIQPVKQSKTSSSKTA